MSDQQPTDAKPKDAIRIAKAMADAGLCSRREAERWIEAGRVMVNGKTLETPAVTVTPSDRVTVDGEPLPSRQDIRLWRYHKPRGTVTTNHDPEGRTTIFDTLPASLPRVITVGRLDYNTEGLLLLTTNGELARHMEHPTTRWRRNYRVRARGNITQERLDKLQKGVKIDDVRYLPIRATLDDASNRSTTGKNVWLSITLQEGKNREVRKVLASLGLVVNRLIRISYGPFQLGNLEPGEIEEVAPENIASQIGSAKAKELNFEPTLIVPARQKRPESIARKDKKSDKTGHAKAKPRKKKPPAGRSQKKRSPS